MTAIDHLRAVLSDPAAAAAAREFLASVECDGEVLDKDARRAEGAWVVDKKSRPFDDRPGERRSFPNALAAVAYMLRQRGPDDVFFAARDSEPCRPHVRVGNQDPFKIVMVTMAVTEEQIPEYEIALRDLGV
jgi:hypothetical protein